MKILALLALFMIAALSLWNLRLVRVNRSLLAKIKNNEETRRLEALAFTDALTGIANRTAYAAHIDKLEKEKTRKELGIVLFDVDNFKEINDTKGHLTGDAVLKMVADALTRAFLPPHHTVYRIGGDEFAVISKDVAEEEMIEGMLAVRKILENEGDTRLSGGYATIRGDINIAFCAADEMLYADKFSRK